MFSSTSKYAIRAVLYLAMQQEKGKWDKKVGIKKIAEDLHLPVYFLGKIMQTLVRKKILVSHKGPSGGFSFYRDPYKISLLDIVEVFDGTEIFDECVLGLKLCEDKDFDKSQCPFSKVIDLCMYRLKDLLKQKTVGEIASSLKSLDDFVMI
jgi:Rrf2 family protein